MGSLPGYKIFVARSHVLQILQIICHIVDAPFVSFYSFFYWYVLGTKNWITCWGVGAEDPMIWDLLGIFLLKMLYSL